MLRGCSIHPSASLETLSRPSKVEIFCSKIFRSAACTSRLPQSSSAVRSGKSQDRLVRTLVAVSHSSTSLSASSTTGVKNLRSTSASLSSCAARRGLTSEQLARARVINDTKTGRLAHSTAMPLPQAPPKSYTAVRRLYVDSAQRSSGTVTDPIDRDQCGRVWAGGQSCSAGELAVLPLAVLLRGAAAAGAVVAPAPASAAAGACLARRPTEIEGAALRDLSGARSLQHARAARPG